MRDDKPHQGDRFLETLTNKKVWVSEYNVRGDEVVELYDDSNWPIDQFNQRFIYLYGMGDYTFLTYLIDSLIAAPDRYKLCLEIAKTPYFDRNSPNKIDKSEYILAVYNCLEEAFDNCWDPEEEHKSWSAIRERVSADSENNELMVLAAEYLTTEYINIRKDIVFRNSTRIDLAGQYLNRKNKSSRSKK